MLLDGLFGGHTIEDRLAIMKDSRHGTYGVCSIVMLLALRVTAVGSIANPLAAAGIWLAAMLLARSGALWLTVALPAARSGGAAATAGRTSRQAFGIGAVFMVVLSFVLAGFAVGVLGLIVAYALGALVIWGWITVCRRLIGGQTGDLIGALMALIEIAALTAFMIFAQGNHASGDDAGLIWGGLVFAPIAPIIWAMLFVGVALLVAVGIGLLVSADAGTVIGLTQSQFAQLIVLVVLAIVFAAGAFSRRQKLSTIVANVAVWAAIVVAALVGYTYRESLKGVAAQVFGELSPTSAIVDSRNGTATFRRGIDGHFLVAATVDGAAMPLLFDTGASAVVLSYATTPASAGIDVAGLTISTRRSPPPMAPAAPPSSPSTARCRRHQAQARPGLRR